MTAAVLVHVAGLFCGFSAGPPLVWLVGIAAFIASGRWPARDRLGLVAIAVAGMASSESARRGREACLRALAERTVWTVTVDAEAEPGSFTPAHHACGARLRIDVRAGHATRASTALVRGTPRRSGELLSMFDASVTELRAPSPLALWRSAIGRRLDAHFGADAPLARALLIADMRDLSPTVRERFAAAGMSHMLSVSGLHVGLIAVAVALLTQLLSMPRRRGDVCVLVLTGGYVVLIGAPIAAVRAALMLAAYAVSRSVQRPTSPWAVLAIGAGLPLVNPAVVLDIGYQLSVVGIIALITAGALSRRWTALRARGWRGEIIRAAVASTTATLLTAPLVAATFGRVSVVAPVSNLVAVPLFALLQPMLFLTAVLMPIPAVAQFVADAAHPLLASVDWIASTAAALPGASLPVVADGVSIALAGGACAAYVVAASSRFPGRALVGGTACLVALAWRPVLARGAGMTELHVIDVGQGDAIALRTRSGRWVLFDAGRDWRGGDEGQRDVVPYLSRRGGALVAFVLSHPHSDHVGGAVSTFRALHPGVYLDPGYAGASGPYRASLIEAEHSRIRWARVHPGDSLVVDEATITFLAPDSAWAESQQDPNLASAVARVRVGAVSMLLTGDAEAPEERWLLAHDPQALRADVLKVAHHGSSTSSTSDFLHAVQPRVALVSVGAGNLYGHPNANVLRALASHGAITLRTDRHGSIVVRTDGTRLEVEAGGERWPIP